MTTCIQTDTDRKKLNDGIDLKLFNLSKKWKRFLSAEATEYHKCKKNNNKVIILNKSIHYEYSQINTITFYMINILKFK